MGPCGRLYSISHSDVAKLRSVRGPARFLLFPIVHVPMFSLIPQEGSGMHADYTKRQALRSHAVYFFLLTIKKESREKFRS